MYTLSQMVDDMVAETKRPDLAVEITRYVNQTVRECHFSADRNAALFFTENFREEGIVADTESGFTWTIPEPTTFQKMVGVRYGLAFDDDGNQIWARETVPGRHLNGMERFFYRVGSVFVFAGYGGLNGTISLAWYEFPRALKYKSAASRPAEYDIESGWTYHASVTTPELEEAARELSTNWLLLRWNDVIAEGVRAKLYKRVSDTERARTSYSLYQSLRQGLWTSEIAVLT